MEKFYTCQQVADYYGVKISTVWEWIRTRKLRAIRVGKQYRVPKDAFTDFEKIK